MNAIDIAIKMETDAVGFYKNAVEQSSNPLVKKVFFEIANDEMNHIDMLVNVLNETDIILDEIGPMKEVSSIFEVMKDKMSYKVQVAADEADAFRIAAEMEQKGLEFYQKAESDAQTESEKKLFRRLAVEEKEHLEVFSNTYSFLLTNNVSI